MNDFIKLYERRNRIKTFLMALTALLLSLLAISVFTSCVYDDYGPGTANDDSETYLNLSFLTSSPTESRAAMSRADDFDSNPANPATESSIHSIRVWAFNSNATGDDAIAVSYREEILTTPVNGETAVKTVSMKIPRKSGGNELENLDLFILANAESIEGIFPENTANKMLTRKQLKEMVIKSQFGINGEGKAQASEVPATGLPLSRVITHISVADHVADTETAAAAKSVIIPLVRAISKLHFFFARKADGGTEEALITKIELNEDIIPQASYVFPDATTYAYRETAGLISTQYNGTTTYVHSKVMLGGVSNRYITSVADPTTFHRGSSEKAAEYMMRLDGANFVSQHRTYLRESNRPITGRIYFKLSEDSPEQSTTFTIPSTMKPAARNHELVVYAYFLEGGKLQINPTVLDWEDGGKYNYVDKVEIHTVVEGDYQTHDGGIQVAFNEPAWGPKITFENIYTGGRKWILQSNNPVFGFVIAGDESGEIKNTLEGNGNKETISFYVVPKKILDMANPHNYHANIFLTIVPSNKALINVGEGEDKLPGTSTEISFVQVK